MHSEESLEECHDEFAENDGLIESVLKYSSELIENQNIFNSNINYDPENVNDRTCSDIDDWFNNLFKEKLHRKTKKDGPTSKANEEIERLHEELKVANEKNLSMTSKN